MEFAGPPDQCRRTGQPPDSNPEGDDLRPRRRLAVHEAVRSRGPTRPPRPSSGQRVHSVHYAEADFDGDGVWRRDGRGRHSRADIAPVLSARNDIAQME